jgi:hypothetical protein
VRGGCSRLAREGEGGGEKGERWGGGRGGGSRQWAPCGKWGRGGRRCQLQIARSGWPRPDRGGCGWREVGAVGTGRRLLTGGPRL